MKQTTTKPKGRKVKGQIICVSLINMVTNFTLTNTTKLIIF